MLHAGLRGGGENEGSADVKVDPCASNPPTHVSLSNATTSGALAPLEQTKDVLFSGGNETDSSGGIPRIKSTAAYLTRALSVVLDSSNNHSQGNSSSTHVDPFAVTRLLEEEIREIAVESLRTEVQDAQAALEPAFRAALNATEQNTHEVATQWKPPEVDADAEQATWLQKLSPWLRLAHDFLPGVLFFAGSVCFLLAGIYYMEKMNLGLGPLGQSKAPTSFSERFMTWAGAATTRRESRHFLPVVYVIAGYLLSNWIALSARRSFSSFFMMDQTTCIFLQAVVKYALIIVGSNALLKAMGYNIGLDTLVTSSSIAVGFASQSVLQNFAAGFGILLFRPFKVGDRVCIKEYIGTVTKVMIYETMILTDDGRTLIFPNREVSAQVMENYSTHGWRRVHVPFYTAASSDVHATRQAITDVMADFDHLWRPAMGPRPPSPSPSSPSLTAPSKPPKLRAEMQRGAMTRSPSNFAILKDVLNRSGKRNGILSKVLRLVESEGGEALSAVPGDVLRQLRVLWDQEQRFAKPAPPMLIMLGLTEKGYLWRVMVWAPAPEHDGCFVRLTEAVAKKLQDCHIKLFSEANERNPSDHHHPIHAKA